MKIQCVQTHLCVEPDHFSCEVNFEKVFFLFLFFILFHFHFFQKRLTVFKMMRGHRVVLIAGAQGDVEWSKKVVCGPSKRQNHDPTCTAEFLFNSFNVSCHHISDCHHVDQQ